MPHVELNIDGVHIPSVTEVLGSAPKPWLDRWREKWGVLADRKMHAAGRIGTRFHEGVEALVWGRVYSVDENNRRLYGMLARFEEWREASGFKPEKTELHVVSRLYGYQGTFDATGYLASHPKRLVLFDWKTSNAIYPEMQLQLAAYALALKEQTGVDIKYGVIVLILKDKPKHKIIVKEYKLGKRLTNKFLKRLKEYREARGL